MSKFQAWAASTARGELQPQQIEFGALGSDQVEIAVEHCGICHSDLSMLDNEWGRSSYPIVPATRSSAGSPRWAITHWA